MDDEAEARRAVDFGESILQALRLNGFDHVQHGLAAVGWAATLLLSQVPINERPQAVATWVRSLRESLATIQRQEAAERARPN